ncbi:MAG: Mu-like prophage major head subunit gpT family protein, partial [Planctomycetaceae bacterium]|nr:Mu-like prophage major head subunit gpT family protein [Planctomycetaceae bacterium]
GVRPSFFTNLSALGVGGEIQHGSLSESTFAWSIGTYAKMFRVTRRDMINDDLGFLDGLPTMMAKSALRTLSDLIWTTILANGGSFYASGNGNYQEGAGTSLQVSSLQSLVALMRTQRDTTGNDLDIVPKTLVVPPELETTARALLNSELLGRDDEQPTGNPLKSIATLEVESRISNSVKFTGYSTTAFYLFAAPQDAPVIVGFLDGAESPIVETFGLDHDVETLGMSFRCYHDFGTAFGDYRATARSKGAA